MPLDPFSPFGTAAWPKTGGGGGRVFRPQGPEPAPEEPPTVEMLKANTPPPDSVAEEEIPAAVLSEPKFIEPDTLFHQEAEASVKLVLPEGKKHITRTHFELFARTPTGPESICKVEAHAQPDGTAVAKLPTFKPKDHDGGPVEYFFEVTHKLAKRVSTEGLLRKVSEMALKSADHILVPGASFPKDSSFIRPAAAADLKRMESKLKEWDARYPEKAHIVVYGHTDRDEKDGKALSERRAQSAHAFITNDTATWEKLYAKEKWGLAALQTILKDLGHYDGKDNGVDGPLTQAAFRAVQKKAGLKPETGKDDAATRNALFSEYMKGKHDIKIEGSRFRKVAGHPWMGCAANNVAMVAERAAPQNRRVTFILIKENSVFPIYFPCQDGNEAGCQGQCKRAGKRSEAGIKCLFYDELVREEKQAAVEEGTPTSHSQQAWMPIAWKEQGVTEIPGKEHNPRILEYHQSVTNPPENDDDTGAWCASFVNWCLEKAGFKGMDSARAADWAAYGRDANKPILGAIALIKFKKGGHHVGFVVGKKGSKILLLGGNQQGGTTVCVSEFKLEEVIAYRLPNEYTGPEKEAKEIEGSYGEDDYASTR